MHCLAPNTSGDGTGCDNMTAIIVKFNFNNQSTNPTQNETVLSKSTELIHNQMLRLNEHYHQNIHHPMITTKNSKLFLRMEHRQLL